MLATVVCVLSSASEGGGNGALLPQTAEHLVAYERYLTRYAELLFVWGSHHLHVDVLNHLEALRDRRARLGTQSLDEEPPRPPGSKTGLPVSSDVQVSKV